MCVYELGMSLGIWPTFCQSHGLGVSTLSCGAQAQVWFVQLPKTDIRRLQQTGRTAERIISAPLPSLQELYTSRVRKMAKKVTLDPSHPAHSLIELLPSGRRYRAQKQPDTRTVFTPRPYPT